MTVTELIGDSPGLAAVRSQVARLVQHSSGPRRLPAILMQGETGTGKGLVARIIHGSGPRARQPFVDINCAAIPETLLEAELFGFERGAFTDARQAKAGLFQTAHQGTLFLDEIGALSLTLQAKLLKAIEDRTVRRLGSTRSEPVDIWIISATSDDPTAAVARGLFRDDLYHRLSVLTLRLPPLRERGRDVLLLAEHFLARACADYGLSPKRLTSEALAALQDYPWPGNVRELANVMERVVLLAEGTVVPVELLGLPGSRMVRPRETAGSHADGSPTTGASASERDRLLSVLRETRWNLSRAATRLGIPRNTLRYRLGKHGLPAEDPRSGARADQGPAAPGPPRSGGLANVVGSSPSPAVPTQAVTRPSLRWERRRVTIMRVTVFAHPEEPSISSADRTLDLVMEKAQSFGGRIETLAPAELTAVFGLDPTEDAPSRAVLAAMAIRRAAERGEGRSLRQGHSTMVGVHVAEVMIGRAGEVSEIDQTDKRALWAFLETLMEDTEPNTIVVSPATVPFLERRFELIPAAMDEPGAAPVYLVGGRERSGQEIGGRRVTPFLGRTQELAVLWDCLRRARTGRGQVVGIVGDPGIGKSRLVHEFRASPVAGQTAWLTGHCLAHGRATPYLPIVEILRKSFSIEDDDHPAHIGEKLRQGVRQLDPILEWTLPLLGELFGLTGEDETFRQLDPKVKRQRTFEALRSLTVAVSQRRPHVVILEDLQWLDRSTGDYFAFFIESLAGLPLLILTTQRPGYTVRWADKTYYTQIALDVLSERETQTMIAAIVGSTGLPPDLIRAIQEKTEGNPLFIEEITNSLLERSVPTGTDTGIGGTRDSLIEVPATLQDIVRARIDRLEEPVKHTLQTAAVIGRHFGLGLLARVAAAGGDVESHLETLTHAELVHEKRLLPQREYTFKHSVIHDVAYQSLMAHERQELHGAVASALEALCGDRLEEQAEILAHHYARSPFLAKAVAFALLAGDRAARLFANAEATTYYERALAIARTLPPSPEADRWQIDAVLKLAGVGATRQDIERDRLNLESARGLGERLNDQARVARVLYWLGRIHYMLLDAPTAIEYARRSLEIADKLGDDAIAAPPVKLLGRIYSRISPLAQAGVMMERSVGQMRRLGDKNEESTAAAITGEIFGSMGDFSRAFSYADQAIRLAREIKNPFAEACALHLRGLIRDQHGDWVQAIADYEDAARIAEGAKDPFRVYIVRCLEGRAYLMTGDPARGRVLIEQSLQLDGLIGTKFVLAWQKTYLAACLVALGDPATALALCDEAIRLSEDTGEGFVRALAHRTLGEALLRVEPPGVEKAEEETLKAIQIQQEIGARPELARSHLSYARLLQRRGEKDRAQEHRREAVRLFEEMGMTWDLAQAEQLR